MLNFSLGCYLPREGRISGVGRNSWGRGSRRGRVGKGEMSLGLGCVETKKWNHSFTRFEGLKRTSYHVAKDQESGVIRGLSNVVSVFS